MSLKEYQKLCERAVPTYYLKGEKACELDKLVAEDWLNTVRADVKGKVSFRFGLRDGN